jgi:hypothetical protein
VNWIDRPIEPTKMSRRGGSRAKYQNAEQRKAARKRQRIEAYGRDKQERKNVPLATRADVGIPYPEKIVVPPDRLADAERIKHLEHESLTGRLMGDPLPGRSALDKSRSGT